MREILFRGISIGYDEKGNWVYGGILHQTDHYGDKVDKYFIIDGTDTQDYDIGYEYEVDPETVGQYTGLKDKNGKKIFEGDILEAHYDAEHPEDASLTKVIWNENGWMMSEKRGNDIIDDFATKHNEVIGNIYDNPELLKECKL